MDSYIIESNKKKSRIPARLDFAQSGTGLILGLFMWVHMLLVGSIIFGKGSFNFVAKTMELSFLSDTGHGFPIAVFFAVLGIYTLFMAHALLGIRKFPISWKQHRILRDQMQMMNHADTNLWYIQVITGFIMFFAGSVHLYVMLTHPGAIDPYLSADRVFSANMWPLYLILLICVELHGTIGLYRLCMKWGWFSGKDARKSRQTLKQIKNKLTLFFLGLGVLSLLVFFVIGFNHRDRVGEKYSSPALEQADAVAPADTHGETKTEQAIPGHGETKAEEPVVTHEETKAEEPVVTREEVKAEEPVATHEEVKAEEPVVTHEQIQADEAHKQEAQPSDAKHE